MLRLTGELADLAQAAMDDVAPVLANARQALRRVTGRPQTSTPNQSPKRRETDPSTPRPQEPFSGESS